MKYKNNLPGQRPPPPEPAPCLLRLRASTQKGGTLIAEEVTERAAHERRLCDPDGYRPSRCARCGEHILHVHDYRERKLRAEPGVPVVRIVRHICTSCEAIWQTLPGFVARHLWRSWRVVELAVTDAAPHDWPVVPLRTRQRWADRLRAAALFLTQVLAVSGGPMWSAIATVIARTASRADLVDAYAAIARVPAGQRLSSLSALVYRLTPKVRLM